MIRMLLPIRLPIQDLLIICLCCTFLLAQAGIPAPPHFYRHQLVDHLLHDDNDEDDCRREYSQRYYTWSEAWTGPGAPILLVIGGEGAIEPEQGLFYPFVNQLARAWGGYVLQPEHRFYGASQPLAESEKKKKKKKKTSAFGAKTTTGRSLQKKAPTSTEIDPRMTLLTPEQALRDAIRLVHHIQDQLRCNTQDRLSPQYCPVLAIGGSYPGFLAAMARLRFPHDIDAAYAASAPMKFYSQQVQVHDYYDHITRVAEKSKAGCARAVRETLRVLADLLDAVEPQLVEEVAEWLGFCPRSVPEYIMKGGETFRNEIMMVIAYTFANDNMANYPPNEKTSLHRSCQTFLNATLGPVERAREFFQSHLPLTGEGCVEMSSQLPTGPNATISSGDWSGVGTGTNGESWDFQTCSWLVEAIGFSASSMFPQRDWSLHWLRQHCSARFQGVTPQPYALVNEWHFDDLVSQNATQILFTNGLNDGWSVGAIKTNLSESLLVLNFENGAHHSDLSHKGPSEEDTDDIRQGFVLIQHILSQWLRPSLLEERKIE